MPKERIDISSTYVYSVVDDKGSVRAQRSVWTSSSPPFAPPTSGAGSPPGRFLPFVSLSFLPGAVWHTGCQATLCGTTPQPVRARAHKSLYRPVLRCCVCSPPSRWRSARSATRRSKLSCTRRGSRSSRRRRDTTERISILGGLSPVGGGGRGAFCGGGGSGGGLARRRHRRAGAAVGCRRHAGIGDRSVTRGIAVAQRCCLLASV